MIKSVENCSIVIEAIAGSLTLKLIKKNTDSGVLVYYTALGVLLLRVSESGGSHRQMITLKEVR